MTTPEAADGLIFDCDGTLIDSMPAHYRAWLAALGAYGLTFDEDRFYRLGGWPTLEVARLVATESPLPVPCEQLAAEKEALFLEHLDHLRPIEPVVAIVREYRGRKPMAVATGAIRAICERMLRQIGLWESFGAIVAADDVAHHKPAPDTYLLAARRLNVAPERCVAYEDTDPGVASARTAGMTVVDVRAFHTPERVGL